MAAGRVVLSQYFPARDRTGRLVSGARLYVYTNGTTTKASIYSDEALAVPLANPVAANSSGQFPAIWAEAGTAEAPVSYTLSITAADGTSIGNPSVFDDYTPSLDAGSADVALAEAAAAAAQAALEDILEIEAEGGDAAAIAGRNARFDYETLTIAGLATIPATVQLVHVAGRLAVGDRGDGFYQRTASEPSHLGKFQSVDGQWWELIPDFFGGVRALQIGAVADDATDDEPAIIAALRHYKKVFLDRLDGARRYYCSPLYLASGETLWGDNTGTEEDEDDLGTVVRGLAGRGPHEPVVGNVTTRPLTEAARDHNIRIYGFTVDGDKANSPGAGEWSHGVQLYAADDVYVNMRAVNCKGDGMIMGHGYEAGVGPSDINCENIRGRIVVEDCDRQGVAITGGVNIDLDVAGYRIALLAFDIENDAVGYQVRQIRIRLFAKDCGTSGSAVAGGFAVYGFAGEPAQDVTIDFQLVDCLGLGLIFRCAQGCVLRGSIRGDTYDSLLAGGAQGAGDPSQVTFDVDIYSTVSLGRLWDNGGSLTGEIRAHSQITGAGLQLRDFDGGDLSLDFQKGAAVGGTYGLLLYETHNMIIRGKIKGFRTQGVSIDAASSGNRIYADCSGNNVGTFQEDIDEIAGCDNNRFFNQKNSVVAVLTGASSMIQYEPYPGVATRGDAAVTINVRTSPALSLFTTTLTATRLVTLSTTNAKAGDRLWLVRTAGGAFDLTIGTTGETLRQNQGILVEYTGSAWQVVSRWSIARETGWTAGTGTANKGAYNADTMSALAFTGVSGLTISNPPTQAEVVALRDAVVTALTAVRDAASPAARRVLSLEAAMRAAGDIN